MTSNPLARRLSATTRTCELLRTSTPQVMSRSPAPSSVRISAIRSSRSSHFPSTTSTRASPQRDGSVSGFADVWACQLHFAPASPKSSPSVLVSPQTSLISLSTSGHDRHDSDIGAVVSSSP